MEEDTASLVRYYGIHHILDGGGCRMIAGEAYLFIISLSYPLSHLITASSKSTNQILLCITSKSFFFIL
jgi:hypothetical protein